MVEANTSKVPVFAMKATALVMKVTTADRRVVILTDNDLYFFGCFQKI